VNNIFNYGDISITYFFFNKGIYFLALAKLAARFFLLIFAFRSLVPLRARYRTGIIEDTLGSVRNRLLKSKNKINFKFKQQRNLIYVVILIVVHDTVSSKYILNILVLDFPTNCLKNVVNEILF